jgi:iron complex outermembrane recepter protein
VATRSVLAITAVVLIAIQTAHAAETSNKPAETEEVTVTGEATGSLTSVSPEESRKEETQVPGGFTIKTAEEMKRGRASNFQDLLQRAPGVFLQSENGAEVSKISIRGSGITSEDEPLGVMFLLDGLSFNQADGEAILEDFDVAALGHAEIFRGANALRHGALTLGGAINLVPLTGYDAAPFQVRLEGGSYGYFRGQMSGGAVEGLLDQFGSIGFRTRDGFREHSREDTEILFADLGYKFNEEAENRFYLTLDGTDRDLPAGLTKSEMENAPSQANPLATAQDWNKNWSYIRLADKLSIRTDEIQFDAGAFWFHRDLEHRGFFSPDFRQGIEMFYSDNFGGSLNFVSRRELFGQRNIFTIGLSPQVEDEHSQNYENLFGHTGATREIFIPKAGNRAGDHLSLEQSYTLNDFQFDRDPVYGDNRIAGIPIHVYEAQLLYEMPSGFYAGPNLQCNFSRYPVDQANTLFADPYALLGFRTGFRRTNGFSVFLDCKNLTNQHYASSIDVIADARTEPNPEIFHPGDGRSFHGAVSWSW